MRKHTKKAVAGLTGAAALIAGASSSAAMAAPEPEIWEVRTEVQPDEDQEETIHVEAQLRATEEVFDKIANVRGDFHFHQDELTPSDEVFSLFGTVATGACAKPGFAFNEETEEVYYVNIKGCVKKSYTLSLKQIKEREAQETIMKCSCSSGMAIANTLIKGIRVSDILEAAELEEEANTITFRASDGYGLAMPLQYVLDKEALLVCKIGDTELTAEKGGQLQVWIPDTVAKYFTRQVVEIDVTAEEEAPALLQAEPEQRAKVSILNRFRDSFQVGDKISFEGYADDCGTAIAAVEFSMDGGETWTTCPTQGANSRMWVYWSFEFLAQEPGTYKLEARAVTEEGLVSPLASSVIFTVQ